MLAVCVAVLTGLFVCVDAGLSFRLAGYEPPWLGYGFLIGTFFLNRFGHYRPAAALAMLMFPVVAFGLVFGGESRLPFVTLGYLALGPMLGAIFLSIRGVALLTALNLVGIVLAGLWAPGVVEEWGILIGPLSLNAMIGVLACLYMHHRNGLESDRKAALLAEVELRKRAEGHLHQAQKMEALGQFAGGIAHDFNNVLMVVAGNAALLSRSSKSHSPELEQIESAVISASALTRQLLAFGRRAVIEPKVLDVGQVVRDAVTMVQRIIGEAIGFELVTPQVPLLARLDRSQLEQVLLNLATNARDAMPQGGTVTVKVSCVRVQPGSDELIADGTEGAYVCIIVEDDGVGMDEATQQRVFEPFFTTKAHGRGTGLGLATVFGVVSQNGGFLRVSSRLGQGSRFDVCFPRVTEAGRQVANTLEPPRASVAPWSAGSQRVLLVEDEDAVRKVVARLLADAGYDVCGAASLAEARSLVRSLGKTIDLVVLDAVLGDGYGIELALELRTRRPGLPIVCISGYAEHRALQDSGIVLLQKPFTREELLSCIQRQTRRGAGQTHVSRVAEG